MPCQKSGKTRNKRKDAPGAHRIYMSDFAGLSVPQLKNLFFRVRQLSSARVALYEGKEKNASLFFAFFQLRRLQRNPRRLFGAFPAICPKAAGGRNRSFSIFC